MISQEGKAPLVEVVQTTPVEKSHILKQALSEHLRADINPLFHHATGGGVDLEGERVEDDLSEVIIVAVTVDELLEVVEDLELTQELLNALIV